MRTPWRWHHVMISVVVGIAALAFAVAAQRSPQNELVQLEQYRERCENLQAVLTALNLGEGSQVADIGAGDGFYSVRIARRIGSKGRIFAVEINQREIEVLRGRTVWEAPTLVPILGAIDDPKLPANTLDAALIVNSYHEMKEYQTMLQHVRSALKAGGLLVIVEPISPTNRNQSREFQVTKHEIGSNFVDTELTAAGFGIVDRRDPFEYRDKACGRVASYNTDVPDWWMIVARAKK